MKREESVGRGLRFLWSYLTFFLLAAFVTTSCMLLFLSALTESMALTFTAENLNVAAKLTFGNMVLLSLLFTAIDTLRRKYTVEKPVKQIVAGAERVMAGDFSVRLTPPAKFMFDDTFSELIDCFNRMTEELGSVETLRTDFIANVSHEMKTPLSVIQNYGTLLQAPELSAEERMEYAGGVTDGARRMADMMTNILKLNRLENQQIFPNSTEFDVGEQLCECLLQYEGAWEEKDIELIAELAENVRVRADRELLSLVWNNLFSNAFKFTPAGGKVTVRLTVENERAAVAVSDTGCGMTAEVGAHIFEKFYQGDTSHAAQGNGLGLALVKRVVDILHGEISVESAVGVGTTFIVRIGGVAG